MPWPLTIVHFTKNILKSGDRWDKPSRCKFFRGLPTPHWKPQEVSLSTRTRPTVTALGVLLISQSDRGLWPPRRWSAFVPRCDRISAGFEVESAAKRVERLQALALHVVPQVGRAERRVCKNDKCSAPAATGEFRPEYAGEAIGAGN